MNTDIYHTLDIDKLTLDNLSYRKVLYSRDDVQLTLQTLLPGEDIPFEVHKDAKQSFKFVEGEGEVIIMNGMKDHGRRVYKVRQESYVIVPKNTLHYVRNTSSTKPLKLYADYSGPVHDPDEVVERQRTLYKLSGNSFILKHKENWFIVDKEGKTKCRHSFPDLSEVSGGGQCPRC